MKLVIFDLDDTLLRAYGRPEDAWRKVALEFSADLQHHSVEEIVEHLTRETKAFWGDTKASTPWRKDVIGGRREITRRVFAKVSNGQTGTYLDIAVGMADRFSRLREEEMVLFPDALPTLRRLRASGMKVALLTNGGTALQRGKIERFALTTQFDHIQIEEEAGVGKPNPDSYRLCLESCGIGRPTDAIMVGDNLEWDVLGPKRHGLSAIWFNPHGTALPTDLDLMPDHIATTLAEVGNHLTGKAAEKG